MRAAVTNVKTVALMCAETVRAAEDDEADGDGGEVTSGEGVGIGEDGSLEVTKELDCPPGLVERVMELAEERAELELDSVDEMDGELEPEDELGREDDAETEPKMALETDTDLDGVADGEAEMRLEVGLLEADELGKELLTENVDRMELGDGLATDEGTGREEVSLDTGEAKEPDMPVRLGKSSAGIAQ